MEYRYDTRLTEDYGLDDEYRDQKRQRQNKRSGGKHRRDSLEGRDDRHDRWN